MTRKEKISLLKRLRAGELILQKILIENEIPLPSWYWQQFETEKELLKELQQTRGEGVRVLWQDGKPYAIGGVKKQSKKPTWF